MMKLSMIIPAAGFSRRMGVFKPLLPVGSEPAVLRCIRTARAAGVGDITVVSGRLHERLEGVVRAAEPEVRLVYNDRYAEGMFSSVYAGASALPDGLDAFFLLPADCCAVGADTLAMLIAAFAESGGTSVTRPRHGASRGHPPLIPAAFLPALLNYSGENGLKGFLRPLPTIEKEARDAGVLLDMDTPTDYAALLEHLGQPAYPDPAQSAALLEGYGTPPDITEHGRQVAATALAFGARLSEQGCAIDLQLLESACLLHDICRREPNHAAAGMELLLREGYPKAAILVGGHMDAPETPPSDITEAELLFLADKLCRNGKITAIEDTMAALRSKLAGSPEALENAARRMAHASAILDILSRRYGIDCKKFAQSAD